MTRNDKGFEANRRVVLQAGAAVGSAVALGSTAAKAEASAGFYRAVVDERFAESAAFAAEMQRRGVPVSTIRADVTPFYNEVYGRWKEGPTLIAGLTSADALFSLELMASAAQMRVVLRAEQRLGRSGAPEWALEGPADVIDTATLLPGQAWGAHAARLAAACPGTWTTTATARAACAAPSQATRERLTAWVLAPLKRV